MATIRQYLSVLGLLSAGVLASHGARAATACTNDIDCTGNAQCGGDICDWNQVPHKCIPAGTNVGMEGWCTVDADCKCKAEGAKCVGTYCSFTKPATGAGGAGAGGASGSAGAAAGGTSAAGSSASAGSSSTPAAASDSGGCSVIASGTRGSLGLALIAGCAAALVGARRRRRA